MMNLDSYFAKMPETRNKIKKKGVDEANANASASDGEATSAEADTRGAVDQNILLALSKITDNITKSFDAKIETVLAAIHDQTSQMQALSTRVDDAETRISEMEDDTRDVRAKVTKLEKQVSDMADQIDDLENRNRRCNVRLINLPEGMETRDPVDFLEKWIPTHLKLTTKAGRIKLDRAHRSLAPRNPNPGGNHRPRPIIIKFHNFTDKQRVMAAARRLGSDPNQHDDQLRVSFFNDFSAAVIRKRKAFDAVKSRLRSKKMVYALLYPALLKITINGAEKRFDSPEAVASYLDSLS